MALFEPRNKIGKDFSEAFCIAMSYCFDDESHWFVPHSLALLGGCVCEIIVVIEFMGQVVVTIGAVESSYLFDFPTILVPHAHFIQVPFANLIQEKRRTLSLRSAAQEEPRKGYFFL